MSRLRLGIVGPGLIWRRTHEPILRTMQDKVHYAAFSAHSQATRDAVAAQFPDAKIFADYHDLVASPEVDVVVVITPLPLNAPVAIAALEAGKDVIMEKPMARSVAEAQRVIQVGRASGCRIAVLEQMAYAPAILEVKKQLQAGAIGEPVMFEMLQHSRSEPVEGQYASTHWRIEADFPLGTLFDGGHHAVASLSTLFGPPKALYASGVQLRPEYGEYDHVMVMLEYGGKLRGMLSESSYLGHQRNHRILRGTQGLISFGREGVVLENEQGSTTIDASWSNSYEPMWHEFIDAFLADEPVAYDEQCALRELIILDTIDRSIKSGQRLTVELC